MKMYFHQRVMKQVNLQYTAKGSDLHSSFVESTGHCIIAMIITSKTVESRLVSKWSMWLECCNLPFTET